MSDHAFRNQGDLFGEDRFNTVSEQPEWNSEQIQTARLRLEELFEKRDALEEEVEITGELQNQYYWISAVLRCLGYTYSVAEHTPGDEMARPDFTLFHSVDDFRSAASHRGEREFFAHATAVVRGFAWDSSLDEFPEGHEGPSNPAFEIDRSIRATSVNWGILTNGRHWRLYHRDSSGLFSTFYEVDLVAALQAGDLEEFKYFWCIFSPNGLGGFDTDAPLAQRMLH